VTTRDRPDVRPGDVLRADEWNALSREVRRLGGLRGAPGIDVRQGAGAPSVALRIPPFLRRARVTGGNVAAFETSGVGEPGVGIATLYEWDATNRVRILGEEEIEILNDYPAIIPDETDIWLCYWEGEFWIEVINCPAPP
jgi:hypothetical protein